MKLNGVEDNTKVDQSEDNKMRGHEMTSKAIMADEQSAKLINPSKSALGGEAEFIDCGVKKTSGAGFWAQAISRVVSDIGNKVIVETGLASGAGVKGDIGIEEREGKRDAQAFEKLESGFEMVRQLPGVIMIARNNVSASDDKAIAVRNRQDIGSFGVFTPLIGNRITALFGNSVAAIKVQV